MADALEFWIGELRTRKGMSDAEIEERRRILEEFCEFTGMQPQEIIETCADADAGKIRVKGRKQIEASIAEFAGPDGTRAATDRANVIRSFLIHNGVRVLPPRPSWLG